MKRFWGVLEDGVTLMKHRQWRRQLSPSIFISYEVCKWWRRWGVQLAAAKWAISNVLCTVLTPPTHTETRSLLALSAILPLKTFVSDWMHFFSTSYSLSLPPFPSSSPLFILCTPSPHLPTNEVHQWQHQNDSSLNIKSLWRISRCCISFHI